MRESTWLSRSIGVVVAIVSFLLVFNSLGVAAEFSADLVMKPKGEQEMTGKIYVKGNKMRHEITEEGEKQIMIARPDKGVTWMITPEEKMYLEMPFQETDRTFEEWTPEKEKNAKYIGEENVSGLACKKYETIEDGEKTYLWISQKYSFPIKIEDVETTIEYKNFKDGPVADSLFEVPSDYQKMSMPGNVGAPK